MLCQIMIASAGLTFVSFMKVARIGRRTVKIIKLVNAAFGIRKLCIQHDVIAGREQQ